MKDTPKTNPLSKTELFGTQWEPKSQNRFLVHIRDDGTKKDIIPPYVVKSITRPSFHLNEKKVKEWSPMKLKFYEPIVPSLILFSLLKAGVFTVTVRELGPVGDDIEVWCLPQCKFSSITPTPLDWSSAGDISTVEAELDWHEIIVNARDSEWHIRK